MIITPTKAKFILAYDFSKPTTKNVNSMPICIVSAYVFLKQLQESGYIIGKKEGRCVNYELTTKGKKLLDVLKKNKFLYEDIENEKPI